ncbi:hypothetical protein MHYP_G00194000 [Metynnis hypsauchen]
MRKNMKFGAVYWTVCVCPSLPPVGARAEGQRQKPKESIVFSGNMFPVSSLNSTAGRWPAAITHLTVGGQFGDKA